MTGVAPEKDPGSGRQSQVAALNVTAALLLLVLAWFVLSAPWLVFDRVVPWDSKDQFYPTLHFVSESLRAGELPFWNPYVYSGYPTVSDPQSMMFSPLAVSLMTIVDDPSIHWFDAIELIHLLMGGIGMLLLSVRFGYSPTAGLYAALVYMFGGSAAGRMQHVPMIYAYGYFPFALLALETMLESRRLRWAIAFGVVAGVMAAHQNQVAYLFSLVLLGYAVHRILSSDSPFTFVASRWRAFAAAGVSGALTLSVPVYATLQFLALSNRVRIPIDTAGENSLHPLSWITLLVQDFLGHVDPSAYWGLGDLTETYLYLGALPVVLWLRFGVAGGVAIDRRFRFFLLIGVLAVLYSLGNLTPFHGFLYQWVPGVSFYRRPADASFVINMVLALGTGFLFERVMASGVIPVRRAFAVGAVVVCAGLAGLGILEALRRQRFDGLLGDVLGAGLWIALAWILLGAMATRSREWLALAGLALLTTDLAVHNAGRRFNADSSASFRLLEEEPASDSLARFLKDGLEEEGSGGPYRVEFVTSGSLWANAPMVLGIQSTQGYNPLRYELYERGAGAAENHTASRPFPPMLAGYDSPMLDLLGVRYVVSAEQLPSTDTETGGPGLALVRDGDTSVWENTNPKARVVAATSVYLEPDPGAAIDTGRMADVDYGSTVVLDHWPEGMGAPPGPRVVSPLPGSGGGVTRITSYTNTQVEIEVEADQDVILVLHDLYYPYWNVRIDGVESELLQANYLFRGVRVPSGDHRVVFRFVPFAPGMIVETLGRYSEARRAAAESREPHSPHAVSVTPSRGDEPSQVFVFEFSDPDGYRDIARETVLFNGTLRTDNGCYLYHEGAAVHLSADDGVNWLGPVVLGASQTLENSQCRINGLGSSVAGDGEVLSLRLDLAFLGPFEGTHTVWAYAEDGTTLTAFAELGRWAVWGEPPTFMDRVRFLLGIPGRAED